MMNLYLLLLSLCLFVHSDALSTGAPISACQDLMPRHSGIGVQRKETPYEVSAVKQGGKVIVKISSNIGDLFQGFILQARSNRDRNHFIDGEFTNPTNSKTIGCFRQKKNTLTHVNKDPKEEVIAEWTPRGSIDEEVVFRATVAKTYALFWDEVDSRPVRVKRGGSSMSSSGLSSNRGESQYADCLSTKGCFGFPSGCVSRADCDVLLTYAKVDNGIRFGMHSYLQESTYMAMGISEDQRMGEDSVTECFRDGSTVKARESWNSGQRNTLTVDIPRSEYSGDYTNGLTSCYWIKPYLSESNNRRFDLENEKYYVLVAKGSMNNGNLGYHGTDKVASGEAVNFTAFEDIGASRVHDAIKIHGTFMVTAWVGFVSMAILLARHFKNTWENSTLGGVKIWFALHRGFMLVALMFFVIAFIVIFIHRNGWNYETSNPHAILGCIAVALGIFNPIMALFRPAPDHKNRPVFNWLHWAVGNAAHLIAIITIFFAVPLPSTGLKSSFYWVMGIYVIVHCIFHLLYQAHSWSQLKKKNNDIGMNEMNGSRTNGHNAQSAQAKNVSENVFRILLLGIYCIFLLSILIALYALIGAA